MPGTNLNNLDAYNEVEAALGGAGGQPNDIVAVRAIAVLEGVSGGPASLLDDNMVLRLNAIDVGAGGPGGHLNTLDALNSIVVLKGGLGGHENDLDAINEWVDFANGFIGILDTVSGAVAAYSIRRLTSAFSGSLLRVRRSSDDAELDIGFDGAGDLDTAAMEAFCGAGDGFVVTWYDQSGNAKDATNATASEQPEIVSTGTTLTDGNGNSSLSFNASILVTPTIALSSFTCSLILDEAIGGAQIIVEHGPNAFTEDGFWMASGEMSGGAGSRVHGVTNNVELLAPIDDWWNDGNVVVCTVQGDGSGVEIFKDGTSGATSLFDPGTLPTKSFFIGSRSGPSAGIVGFLGEVLLFSPVLSSGDRTTITDDQKTFFGVS